jgi:RNA 3'-terminal phosphate cyclase-like protein
MEQLTNGCTVEINYTGTAVVYKPGIITGGVIEFDCGVQRSIPYFLEPLLCLAPFSKLAFKLTLTGLTCDSIDATIDILRNVNIRLLKPFGLEEGIELTIKRRGAPPLGGGQVFFTCPIVTSLKPVQLGEDAGRIKKIRGISSTTRVSPQISNRQIEAARGVLNPFIPDVYIYSDVYKGEDAGLSPGYSLSLVAESTTGALLSACGIGAGGKESVEEAAQRVAKKLLKQILQGGYVDEAHQWMLLLLMTLTTQDLSTVILGPLSDPTKVFMADLKEFFGMAFKVKRKDREGRLVHVSCIGSGYQNFSRRSQ